MIMPRPRERGTGDRHNRDPITFRLPESDHRWLEAYLAATPGLSRSGVIVRAVQEYRMHIEQMQNANATSTNATDMPAMDINMNGSNDGSSAANGT
jgi:hypothetical protein